MPQPYPKHLLPQITNENLAQRRPLFLLAGMDVISQNSMVDGILSNAILPMLGSDPEAAAVIFGSLRNSRAQREALVALAENKLTADDRSLFKKILGLVEAAAKSRDTLAHQIWMADDQLPDAVTLVRPDSLWRTSHQSRSLNAAGQVSIDDAKALQEDIRKACSVWKLGDFDDARRRAVYAFTALTGFSLMGQTTDEEERTTHRQTVENVFVLAGQSQ